jgi:hypothetical protein
MLSYFNVFQSMIIVDIIRHDVSFMTNGSSIESDSCIFAYYAEISRCYGVSRKYVAIFMRRYLRESILCLYLDCDVQPCHVMPRLCEARNIESPISSARSARYQSADAFSVYSFTCKQRQRENIIN